MVFQKAVTEGSSKYTVTVKTMEVIERRCIEESREEWRSPGKVLVYQVRKRDWVGERKERV